MKTELIMYMKHVMSTEGSAPLIHLEMNTQIKHKCHISITVTTFCFIMSSCSCLLQYGGTCLENQRHLPFISMRQTLNICIMFGGGITL